MTNNTKSIPEVLDEIEDSCEDVQFNLSNFLSKNGADQGQLEVTSYRKRKNFEEVCQTVKKHLDKTLVEGHDDSTNKDSAEWLEHQHNAIIGDPKAIQYVTSRIEDAVKELNISPDTEFPPYFDDLYEAIFHAKWGRQILQKWYHYPESEAAVITGTELWLDIDGQFVKQSEEFDSREHVWDIIEAFKMKDENAVVNAKNPELEIDYADGTRVTIIIPPRSRDYFVIFRRFVVNNFTLEEQASMNTITEKDVPLFRSMARLMLNTFIAGRVRSAKTTFLKTLIQERSPDYIVGCLEKHFELALKLHMPERLFAEFQSTEGELHKTVPRLLRVEHDYIVIGECRSKEFEGAMQACERGERGLLSTYHITKPSRFVPQIARHLCDEYPNRRPEMEVERVADNIDVVITMTTGRNRSHKLVKSVSEIIWDDEKKEYHHRDWIRYNYETGSYEYCAAISPSLKELMYEESKEDADRFISLLEKRASQSPMTKEV